MKRLIVLSGYGVSLRVRRGVFQVVRRGAAPEEIPPVEVDAIVVDTRAASVSSAAVVLAGKLGIDIVFFDGWRPSARLLPATYGSTLRAWEAQMAAARKRRVEFARLFAWGKVYNQRQVLYRLAKTKRGMGRSARAALRGAVEAAGEVLDLLGEAGSVGEARRLEARAARAYWRAVASVLPGELGFRGRLKRYSVPRGEGVDAFNAALNIGYTLLLREEWRAVFNAGLNPYYGFLHVRRPGRMSLVLDLMEEFRAVAVDYPLIRLAWGSTGELARLPEDRGKAGLVWSTVWEAIVGGERPLRPAIQLQARRLAEALVGGGRYEPYRSPW